ncbi:1055_t:CDS:1, partial [Racocetra persica]
IVDVSEIINSQSLDSPQKVFLKRFYSQDLSEEFNLITFEKRDIILVTSKFQIV